MSPKQPPEVSTIEKSPTEISPNEEYIEVFKNWKQLKGQDPLQLFKDGWKPSVRTRKDGYRYIRLRRGEKGKDGKWKVKEKALGGYDPERWEALLELFPDRDKIFPQKPVSPRKSMVLSSKVAKPKPLQSTVHFTTETLHWYQYLQQKCGYPGTLEQFINEAINELFTVHHGLQLAVVITRD